MDLPEREAISEVASLIDLEVARLPDSLTRQMLTTTATRLRWFAARTYGVDWEETPELWHLVSPNGSPFCGAEPGAQSTLGRVCIDCVDAATLLGDLTSLPRVLGEEDT